MLTFIIVLLVVGVIANRVRLSRQRSAAYVAILKANDVKRDSAFDLAAAEHAALEPEFLETLKILGDGEIKGHESCSVCHPRVIPEFSSDNACDEYGHAWTLGGECVSCDAVRAGRYLRLNTRYNPWVDCGTCADLDVLLDPEL